MRPLLAMQLRVCSSDDAELWTHGPSNEVRKWTALKHREIGNPHTPLGGIEQLRKLTGSPFVQEAKFDDADVAALVGSNYFEDFLEIKNRIQKARPDLVICDNLDLVGRAASVHAGIMTIEVVTNVFGALQDAIGRFDHLRLPSVAEARSSILRLIDFLPDTFYSDNQEQLPIWDRFRHENPPDPPVPYSWPVPDLDELEGKTVFVSLGTVSMPYRPLQRILDGLATTDLNVYVALGAAFDRMSERELPRRKGMHIWRTLPQPELLKRADLFISHGGFNSLKESLGAGVPMALVPLFGDQPYNADIVCTLGAGHLLNVRTTAEELARQVMEMLDDSSYVERAEELRDRMNSLRPVTFDALTTTDRNIRPQNRIHGDVSK